MGDAIATFMALSPDPRGREIQKACDVAIAVKDGLNLHELLLSMDERKPRHEVVSSGV